MTEMTMNLTFPAFEPGTNNPFLDIWWKVAGLYKDGLRADSEQLWVSSTRIIQEHTMRALVQASQSCAEALAKNAADMQQKSVARMAETNQKAMEMMGQAFVDAWTAGFKPGR
jgi:hypothetical protein